MDDTEQNFEKEALSAKDKTQVFYKWQIYSIPFFTNRDEQQQYSIQYSFITVLNLLSIKNLKLYSPKFE